jgi:hypothetical protein
MKRDENSNMDHLKKELKSMPEPNYEKHFNRDTQEQIHRNLMDVSEKERYKKRYKNILQPVFLSMAGIAALLLFISFVIPVEKSPLNGAYHDDQIQEQLEAFFHESMNEAGRTSESYSIFHTQLNVWEHNDGLILFTERGPEELEVHMVYFLKEDGSWKWFGETGTTWKSKENWRVAEKVPYVYSGALSDDSVAEVLVDGKKATMIHFNAHHRFWYVKVDKQFATVTYKMKNGEEVSVDRIEE